MEMPKNKISKTKETAEWNCSVCKIDVHLYAAIVCDGWNHLKCVGLKASPKSMYFLCNLVEIRIPKTFSVCSSS